MGQQMSDQKVTQWGRKIPKFNKVQEYYRSRAPISLKRKLSEHKLPSSEVFLMIAEAAAWQAS